jgi:peptidyl-prolyl cis-trans isomerase B (cyclophilin B)
MIILKTNLGDIKIELNFDKAPLTAKNFQQYVEDGFYNGTIFHRVIKGFMAQGGGFASGLEEKDSRETIQNNDFLNFKNESVQGWGYCVFAEVIEGMDIVDKMTLVETGRMGFHDDVPTEEIIIESAIVE